jgi:hypothetical protein
MGRAARLTRWMTGWHGRTSRGASGWHHPTSRSLGRGLARGVSRSPHGRRAPEIAARRGKRATTEATARGRGGTGGSGGRSAVSPGRR